MNLDEIDTTAPGGWGLLLRHAERFSITGKGIGMEVPLTDNGRAEARALGAALAAHPWHRALAGPVLRCHQTATEVLVGRGIPAERAATEVITEPMLSGAYVFDQEAAIAALVRGGPEEIILRHARGEAVPGMRSVTEGSELLLRTLRQQIAPGKVSLFISHDALVLPFQRHYLAKEHSRQNWIAFLDGSVIYAEGSTTIIDGQRIPALETS